MRHTVAALIFFCTLFTGLAAAASSSPAPIRIGLAPVFLLDQTALVQAWRSYLESRLKRPVLIIQRASYREISDLLRSGKLDFAWLCGAPFASHKTEMNLLAVPLYQGKPTYRSYLIVPATDQTTNSIADLRDKVFAYSDPDSNAGYLVPVYDLLQIGEKPASFFNKTFFTWSHRKVIEAVAAGVAQGGSVGGYVWETLALHDPELAARTRVVKESIEFSFPPFVAARSVAPADVAMMRKVLLGMSQDAEGIVLLRRLRLDGYVAGKENMYDDIARMLRTVGEQ